MPSSCQWVINKHRKTATSRNVAEETSPGWHPESVFLDPWISPAAPSVDAILLLSSESLSVDDLCNDSIKVFDVPVMCI